MMATNVAGFSAKPKRNTASSEDFDVLLKKMKSDMNQIEQE